MNEADKKALEELAEGIERMNILCIDSVPAGWSTKRAALIRRTLQEIDRLEKVEADVIYAQSAKVPK